MNSEIKNIIIGTMLTAILTAIGYMIKVEYFDKKTDTELYIKETHKALFNESDSILKNTKDAYRKIINILEKNYGTTPLEFKVAYENIFKIKLEIIEYRNKLEKFSFDDTIRSIENIINVLNNDIPLVGLHFNKSKIITENIGRILYNSNSKEIPKVTDKLMAKIKIQNNKELIDFINYENFLFFKFQHYSLPLIKALERNFDYQFRKRLNLGTTDTLVKKINEIPELIKKWESYEYDDKNYPFIIANMRSYAAPELKLEGDLLKNKNQFIQSQILLKFIMNATITTYNLDKNNTK